MPTTWDDSLSVGVPELDREHEEIMRRLDALGEAIGAGRAHAVGAELKALQEVVTAHFVEEERWMEAERYPHRASHARAHRTGLEALGRAVQAYQRGGVDFRFLDLVERAARWLDVHLRAADLRMGMYQGIEQLPAPARPLNAPAAPPPGLPLAAGSWTPRRG